MPATVNLLGQLISSASGDKQVSATPTAGNLIVIVGFSTFGIPVGVSDNQGGTYTEVEACLKASSNDGMKIWVANRLTPSAVSTLFVMDTAGTATGGGIIVLEMTEPGEVGAAAVRSSGNKDNIAAASSLNVLLNQPGLSINPRVTAGFNATNPSGLGAGSGHTSLVDTGFNTPTTGILVAIGANMAGNTSPFANNTPSIGGSVGIELLAASTDTGFLQMFR